MLALAARKTSAPMNFFRPDKASGNNRRQPRYQPDDHGVAQAILFAPGMDLASLI